MPLRVRRRRRSAAADAADPPAERAEPTGRSDPERPPNGDPTDPPPAPQDMPAVTPAVVPRWIQAVMLPLALLGLWALARAAGPVLLILVAAAVIALILNPLVQMIEHRRVPRGLAILLVYLGGVAILVGVGLLVANPISTQVSHFQTDVPRLVKQANQGPPQPPELPGQERGQGPRPAAGRDGAADPAEDGAQALG